MGYEVHVLAPYSFYGEELRTKYQVEEKIKECQEGRDVAVKALYKLAYMTDPQKFMDKDYEGSPEQWLDERIEAAIHDIEVASVDLYKYNVLLEMWDQYHMTVDEQEKTITLPKELRDKKPIWQHAYGEGDWIDPVYPDGTPVAEEDY